MFKSFIDKHIKCPFKILSQEFKSGCIDKTAAPLAEARLGSNPTVNKNFSFYSFCLLSVPLNSSVPIQMLSSMTFIRGNRCIKRTIILKI